MKKKNFYSKSLSLYFSNFTAPNIISNRNKKMTLNPVD